MATQNTKYSLSDRERRHLASGITPSKHATHQHRTRAPQGAVSIHDALGEATVDEAIAAHPFYAGRPEDNTDAIACYRGRTAGGTVYGMVYPVALDDPGRGAVATTAYRVRSVPDHAQELADLPAAVGRALKSYLRVLGDDGGIVDE